MLAQNEILFPNFVFLEFSIFYGFTFINIGRYIVTCEQVSQQLLQYPRKHNLTRDILLIQYIINWKN